MAADYNGDLETIVSNILRRTGSDGSQGQGSGLLGCRHQRDDTHQQKGTSSEAQTGARAAIGHFEFVMMASNGALDKGGISQIRAHTTREIHKSRRSLGKQNWLQRRRNRPGNIFFGSQVDAFRTLPQLPWERYKPGIFDEIKHNVFHVYNQKEMTRSIWPEGTKDDAFFTGMMLMCSVHLDGMNMGQPSPVTTALKLEAMRLVRERIGRQSADAIIGCISAIACLATCALVRGEIGGPDEYVVHRKAYAVLIKEAFRQQMFEHSRFCKDVLRVITVIAIARRCRMPVAGLAPLADSATTLQEYEYVFEDAWQSRTHPDPELYSPVYDGRIEPAAQEDPFPYVQREHLRLLLQMMQSVISIWLRQTTEGEQEDETVALDSLCTQILLMPSARRTGLACSKDFMYEVCRLTSVLMIQSVERRLSWRDAAQGTTLVAEIRAALGKTDLDGLWGSNIGLLYWVVLVFHCAAFETSDYPFAHALQTRIHFQLTYEYRDWHGAVKPMLVLKDVMCVP